MKKIIALICCFCLGCNLHQIEEQANEEMFNSMSVTLNDSSYSLTYVVGHGGHGAFGYLPGCKGVLMGLQLYIDFKTGDTLYSPPIYDSCRSISGLVYAESYNHNGATRAKGIFEFTALKGYDTLKFTEGNFDVYLRPID